MPTSKNSSKQRMLLSNGTVEDLEKSRRMFMQLFEALLGRPIIGHTMWFDSITEEQKMRIQAERTKQIKQADGAKLTEATDYEAMVYVMTVSQAGPLSQHWFNMYAYLFRKYYPEKAEAIFDKWEGVKLDLLEKQELQRLKNWLFKTSKKVRK